MDINNNIKTIEELFLSGNYTEVIFRGKTDQWQTYASMGLIGKTEEAIQGLKNLKNPESIFYSAVASWIDGDEERAEKILQKIPTPHAQNLLSLIRKPRIQVLAQIPSTRMSPHDLLIEGRAGKKFEIQNISFHNEDLQVKPYGDIHTYYNRLDPPDFYVCQMIEWHLIPPNIQELPCPIFGLTSDYDLHIQTVYPWLQVFDEIIVFDETERKKVSPLSNIPVSTFPKTFGVSDILPVIPGKPREIDLFLSGSVLHPYHPEKAMLLQQILRIPGIKIKLIDGFISAEDYNNFLGKSKISFTYYRRPGGTVTRGLEALSMGCAVVVQKESVLNLYVNEKHGVLTYDLKSNDLSLSIQKILSSWPDYELRAREGAAIIRSEFSMSRVASQYFRFMTFLAAKPSWKRQIIEKEKLTHKRSILWKGWRYTPEINTIIRKSNLAKWEPELKKKAHARLFIDMARESVLEYATPDNPSDRDKHLLTEAFRIYNDGLNHFPDSLVLRFNLIRTAFHFGNPGNVLEALELAKDTVSRQNTEWELDIMDDVFPWDFSCTFFNYRTYLDIITDHLISKTDVSQELIKLILASIHYYMSYYIEDIDHFKKAFELDPEFPYYKLRYAKQLVTIEQDNDISGKLLEELCENSLLFIEAYYMLRQLYEKNLYKSSKIKEIKEIIDLYTYAHVRLENTELIPELSDYNLQFDNSVVEIHKYKQIKKHPKISIILAGWSGKEHICSIDTLNKQNIPREDYELIWVELYHNVSTEIMDKCDIVVTYRPRGIYHKHLAYNIGLIYGRGKVITICDREGLFPINYIESIISSFNLKSSYEPYSIILTHHEREITEQIHHLSDMKNITKYPHVNLPFCRNISIRRNDAIKFGGFDEHSLFQGSFNYPYELAWRFINAGLRNITYKEEVCIYYREQHSEASTSLFSRRNYDLNDGHFLLSKIFSTERHLPLKENPELRRLREKMSEPCKTVFTEISSVNSDDGRPNFSIIIPAGRQTDTLSKLLDSINNMTSDIRKIELILVIENDNEDMKKFVYNDMLLKKIPVLPRLTVGSKFIAGYGFSSGKYIVLLKDDLIFKTRDWDRKVLTEVQNFPDGIVMVNSNNTNCSNIAVVSRIYYDIAGEICPPEYRDYNTIYNHIFDIFNMLELFDYRRIVYLPEAFFEEDKENCREETLKESEEKLFNELLPLRKTLALKLTDHIFISSEKERLKYFQNKSSQFNKPLSSNKADKQYIETLLEKERILNDIYNSRGWKALCKYYKLRDMLLPENTWRRNFVKKVFRHFINIKNSLKNENILLCCDKTVLSSDSLEISGWAISPDGIDRVEIYLDNKLTQGVLYGNSRPDVEKIYPFIKNSSKSGFYLYVNLSESLIINIDSIRIRAFNCKGKDKEIKIAMSVKEKKGRY